MPSARGYIVAQDLVDAMSPATYMAIFDDANTNNRATVDASTPVTSCLARAHSEVLSYLPRIYETYPPESPTGINSADNIPILLKNIEVQFAILYAYRRHPEYVKTYGAEAGGELETRARAGIERVATAVQEIAPTDSPPEPKPGITQPAIYDNSRRMLIDSPDGTFNGGDF